MSNSIVAVAIVVIALSLVAIDLRQNIFKKILYLSLVMLIIGVGATFSNLNPILGLIINLTIIFFIVYEGLNTYKETLYFPFLLSFIFMSLSAPAKLEFLPLRMVSILVGCLYILIIQLVLNKDRFNKTIFHTKKKLLSTIINRIDYILEGNCEEFSVKEIYPLLQPMIKAIYDNRLKGKVLSKENRGRLLLISTLEKLYEELSIISKKDSLNLEEREFLYNIKVLLKEVENHFYGNKNDGKAKKEILNRIEKLNLCTSDENLLGILSEVEKIIEAIDLIEDNEEEKVDKSLHIKSFMKPIDINSLNFKFASKLAVSISLIILVTDLLGLRYGRWIIFPIIAIIQPCMEGTLKKSLERVLGTAIGIVLFIIIFTLVKDNMIRLNITIFLAYINLFVKKYYISTSLIAVSALGSVAMGGAITGNVLVERIFFAIVGCALGLIVNKYIFSYDNERYLAELEKEYKSHIDELNNSELNETKKYDFILKAKLLKYKLEQSKKTKK